MKTHMQELEAYVSKLSDKECYLLRNNLSLMPESLHNSAIGMFLVGKGIISTTTHMELLQRQQEYKHNLSLFDSSPHAVSTHGKNLVIGYMGENLGKPNSKDKYCDYIHTPTGIRINVRTSRAIAKSSMASRALSVNDNIPFAMNINQIKLQNVDIFIIVGLWADVTRFWLLPSHVLANLKDYISTQHTFSAKGKEGQYAITDKNIESIAAYETYHNKIKIHVDDYADKFQSFNTRL